MRGISFGMVPTSLLAMVDAAIGGKNGVNSGDAKNMVGTINQPDLIAFDPELLATLPSREWSGGFAEIIKYACLFDKQLFDELELHNIYFYKENISATTALIKQCVAWKNKVVLEDEHETGKRKLLNFGHTLAHALEKTYSLSHGEAVAIGMVAACYLSEQCLNLDRTVQIRLSDLLKRYGLPITLTFDVQQIMQLLKSDKKRDKDAIDYILLRHIGEPEIVPIHTEKIEKLLSDYASHY
jgi:3-dehydroquinate synthase